VAPHFGAGATRQAFIHLDDLAELFVRALDRAPAGAVLHGVAGEISMLELARAVGRMTGAGVEPAAWTLEKMYAGGGSAGISMSLNKRMSAERTHELLGWKPTRADIIEDIESGSYAHPGDAAI
jgi:nucleoside-diphosphate-sugar epimerase